MVLVIPVAAAASNSVKLTGMFARLKFLASRTWAVTLIVSPLLVVSVLTSVTKLTLAMSFTVGCAAVLVRGTLSVCVTLPLDTAVTI